MFHTLEPEVAGGFGEQTILDNSTHPPDVKWLHYVLDGWLGDDILESFPCYIVTERLRRTPQPQNLCAMSGSGSLPRL